MFNSITGTPIFRAALLCGVFSTFAIAGPPLMCHQFDIGTARSLPWGNDQMKVDSSYDRSHLIADTLALLTPQTPILVRMETLRRATYYAMAEPSLAYELLARVMARALDGDSMGTFGAGYLIETYKQANPMFKKSIASDMDGYGMVVKSLDKAADRPAMEFAASLMNKQKWPNAHTERARSGSAANPLLARNLKSFGLN